MSAKPMPCPFCRASEPYVTFDPCCDVGDSRWFQVVCGCGARGPMDDPEAKAIARWNAAGQDTKRLDWYLGASASPPSIEDWIRGMKEGWTPTQWRAWIDQHLNAEGRQG